MIGQQTHFSVADRTGKWRVVLQPLEVGAPLELTIRGKTNVTLHDFLLVGEVWHETVSAPVAVRYAWADNPVCNLQGVEGLPATPFRTDNWPGVTVDTAN